MFNSNKQLNCVPRQVYVRARDGARARAIAPRRARPVVPAARSVILLALVQKQTAATKHATVVAVPASIVMAEDLFAIGGGAWARDDCEAALEGAGGSVEVALELLMGGFTKHAPQAAESESGSGGTGSGTSAGAAGAESRTDGAYSVEDLGGGLWKVVEADRHGQYPFMYVIIAGAAPTRCVVIDTGCGTADYKAFLDAHINVTGLPYFVICTHVHFDHVGGAHSFGADADIAMGGAAQAFTKNYEITSLGAGHGCPVRPFTVSQWLAHGERISLCPASLDGGGSDSRGNESSGASAPISGPAVQDMSAVVLELEVLHIPGHTPDHIALWWEARAVLFVGDHIYPWTAVDVSGLGHSVPDFVASTELLL